MTTKLIQIPLAFIRRTIEMMLWSSTTVRVVARTMTSAPVCLERQTGAG